MSNYNYGSTARKINIQRELEAPARKQQSHTTRKNRERAKHMSFGYVIFLFATFMVAGVVLIGYVKLQADIVALTEQVSAREKYLNNLKVANDENLCRIESSIDIEEIKRVAIGELGMTYPQEGQIIMFQSSGYDYVRKVDEGN